MLFAAIVDIYAVSRSGDLAAAEVVELGVACLAISQDLVETCHYLFGLFKGPCAGAPEWFHQDVSPHVGIDVP